MNNTMFYALSALGFVPYRDGMGWGRGSYGSFGKDITVFHDGKGYRVAYHAWGIDPDGDLIFEERSEQWLRRHSDVVALVSELKRR